MGCASKPLYSLALNQGASFNVEKYFCSDDKHSTSPGVVNPEILRHTLISSGVPTFLHVSQWVHAAVVSSKICVCCSCTNDDIVAAPNCSLIFHLRQCTDPRMTSKLLSATNGKLLLLAFSGPPCRVHIHQKEVPWAKKYSRMPFVVLSSPAFLHYALTLAYSSL